MLPTTKELLLSVVSGIGYLSQNASPEGHGFKCPEKVRDDTVPYQAQIQNPVHCYRCSVIGSPRPSLATQLNLPWTSSGLFAVTQSEAVQAERALGLRLPLPDHILGW